jgi:hypothetical protein
MAVREQGRGAIVRARDDQPASASLRLQSAPEKNLFQPIDMTDPKSP